MSERVVNFNAGPSTLPEEVLRTAREEMLDYRGTGMSVMEMSHRSPEFEAINDAAVDLTRKVLGLDDRYAVVFMGGGASTQFAAIPMNFLSEGRRAAYVDTGTWSSKAIKEAQKFGDVDVVASSADRSYTAIPAVDAIRVPKDAAYLHVTSNNTIYGTQYKSFPDTGDVPLICDMSSDIASRTLDHTRFAMIYAGAQKNLGPAGVTLVCIREDLLERAEAIPTMLNYRTHASKKSLYNTPPVFAVYMVKLVLEWIERQGGLAAVEAANRKKQAVVYGLLDEHADFYRGTVEPESRSWMNAPFRLPAEELEKTFVAEAKAQGMVGLKGHRSVGGIRVSMYNAMTLPGIERLRDFMVAFHAAHA